MTENTTLEVKVFSHKMEFPFMTKIDRISNSHLLKMNVCCDPSNEIPIGTILLAQQGKFKVEELDCTSDSKGDFSKLKFKPETRVYVVSRC